MNNYVKKKIRSFLITILETIVRRALRECFFEFSVDSSKQDQVVQKNLQANYRILQNQQKKMPKFGDTGFRCYSQNDEDGHLLYIFSLIGSTNKKVVEICAGDGIQCNSANLLINHGWNGLLFDGNETHIKKGTDFYANCPDTKTWPPKLIHAWVKRENVNDLIEDNGFSGQIDLLSLDMDGVDYWIWKAIDVIEPRVVVLEYQDIWGPEKAMTIPYKEDFVAEFGEFGPDYCGASLAAFVKLGKEKGYRLVGINNYGFNAYFLKNGIGEKEFPKVNVSDCFDHPKVLHGMKVRLPNVSRQEWIEV